MSRQVNCPACKAVLRVPDGEFEVGSCPRCLARINLSGPDQAITAAPPSAPAATTCRACGEQVQRGWRFCPACAAPMGGSPRRRTLDADFDVRSDTRKSSVLLIFFAVIGGIAVFTTGWGALVTLTQGDFGSFMGVMTTIGFVLLVGLAIVMIRTRNRPEERGVGRLAFGTLAFAGGLVFTTAALGFAAFAVLFIVCLAGGMR